MDFNYLKYVRKDFLPLILFTYDARYSKGTITTTGVTVNGKTSTTAQYDTIGLVHYKDTDIYFGK